MTRTTALLLFALLAGCGRAPQTMKASGALNVYDVAPTPAPAAAGPRIAYSYTAEYDFDRRTVGEVQAQQLALCRNLGPARCLVVKSTLNAPGPDDHIVSDEAVLLIDARLAGEFNRRLDALATAGGARLANRQTEAEDVTKATIDADARVRAKQALAERLLAIIRAGHGKVGELVEAERAYATTQEELEAARGEQASLDQRVAMSRVTINYAFNDDPGRTGPVRASLADAGDTLATSVAALVTAVVAGVPWLLMLVAALAAVRWLRRRMGWRWPRRQKVVPPSP